MSYPAARTAIVGYISGLAAVDKCEEFPPSNLQTLPCAVIMGAEIGTLRGVSFRTSQYDMTIRFFVKDADLDKAASAAETLKETLITTFDAHVAIGGEVAVLSRQWMSRPSALTYAGKDYTGFDMILTMEIDAGPSMSP